MTNAAFDGARRQDVLRWAEEKIAETNAWATREEAKTLARRRDTEAWVAREIAKIDAQRREALAWVGVIKAAEPEDRTPDRIEGAPSDDASAQQPAGGPLPLAEFAAVVGSIRPWSGRVPDGFLVDALGVITRASLRATPDQQQPGARDVRTELPSVPSDGEGWFEMVDWLVSARDARDDYVAVSLGAAYGAQLVGAWKALQLVNPLPSLLVAVEAVPENCRRIAQHMRDNGIDPENHVIVRSAVGRDNEVVLFPVGAPGSGRNNCMTTNAPQSRAVYAEVLGGSEHAGRILRNLLIRNTTGVVRDLGDGATAEVKFVSAVTLGDILGSLRRVDLLEVDVQQSEGEVIPPFIGLLTRKVRRVHIGTHGAAIHTRLRTLFIRAGWRIVFDYAPDARHETELGSFTTSDGILTARNPAV